MKRKILSFAIIAAMFGSNAYAAGVIVNNNPIDTEAIISEGRTLVPVRGVFEQIGFSVEWENSTKTATLKNTDTTISIRNGEDYFTVNGKKITPDVAQQIVDGRFYLPLRAISEAVGADVSWDSVNKNAIINYGVDTSKAVEEIKPQNEDKKAEEKADVKKENEKQEADENKTVETEDAFKGYVNAKMSDAPSFIYANKDGSYTIASGKDRIYIKTMDKDFNTISDFSVLNNNQKFAGYYYDNGNHYIIMANDNKENKGKTDVYVVERYNKEGKKMNGASLSAESSVSYFDDGLGSATDNSTGKVTGYSDIYDNLLSNRVCMAANGRLLTFSDTVEYKPTGEGNKSINMSLTYDMDHMAITDPKGFGKKGYEKKMDTKYNNSFITYGFENKLSLCWKDFEGIHLSAPVSDSETTRESNDIFKTYANEVEGNKTLTLDGFESTKGSYVAVGTSVKQDSDFLSNSDFNLFAVSVSKYQPGSNKATVKYLTNYSADDKVSFENVHLVKKDDNSLVVIWQENKGGTKTVKYAEITGDVGNISEVKEASGVTLSNCKPAYSNGKLVWFNVTKANGSPVMQTVELK